VFTEIFYHSNIDYLLNKLTSGGPGATLNLEGSNGNKGYNFSSLYAAGEVYIATTIDTITAQAFYNPHIVTIL